MLPPRCVGVGEGAVEVHGKGEKTQPPEKTNSKEDKRDAASIALHATLEGMMSRKDTRKEKHRQDKEVEMNAFMKIRRRRLELDAENHAKMLEMEAEKQAKMLKIEASNAKTKAKEVVLTSMMTEVEIMKVELSTVSLRKRPWFKKMQADMLKFDDE
ncbi:Phospholipid-transporting ATPase 1 [Hordeum vulgare]|nr:Phospholipid-transporting ATPase 1 [Hordeum vulgare]